MNKLKAELKWPGWRSLLFVPVINADMVSKASSRGADALILDMEDSVPPPEKDHARRVVPKSIASLGSKDVEVVVRVNSGVRDLIKDLEACIEPGLTAIMLPKSESAEDLELVDEVLSELEDERGIASGTIGTIALVETARGLMNLKELSSASSRLMALAIGPEDLAYDLGVSPSKDALIEPCRAIAWAAHSVGVVALGFPGPISNYSDLDRLQGEVRLAHNLGFSGALCIHPKQIETFHSAFSIGSEEALQAKRIVEAYEEAQRKGNGVCVVDGQMVDRPVALRAQKIVESEALQKR